MKNHEVMQLCKTIVSRRIQCLEEELNTIFDLLSKEESVALPNGGARPILSITASDENDADNIVLDNTQKEEQAYKKTSKKPLTLSDSMFLTVNPIYNGDDYIEEVAVLFSRPSKDIDFMDFFTSFNFSLVLSNAKYYSLDVAKQLFCSMTSSYPDNIEVLSCLNKKEYFKGVIAYKRDNLYAFNAKGFSIIQENVKKHQEEKEVLPPATIPEFLTRVVDIDKVSRDNLSISDLADIYAKTYGKVIDDRIIRNALVAKHITVISIFGDKRPARGEALAEMLRRYRILRNESNSDKKEAPEPIKPHDGLYTSIGELMKEKFKTTLNK